LSNCVTSI